MSTTRLQLNRYMKERRRKLRLEGMCVDCQRRKAHVDRKTKRRHTCCKVCLAVRRTRADAAKARVAFPLQGAAI